ncbi:MAG: hypothetical protein ABJG86_09030 [Nitratireductor sp.]|uniref:hypothetical protein n=1 Tax=Parasphingorhabdus sp. TaxID=2709688 RepID=UPI0032633BD5
MNTQSHILMGAAFFGRPLPRLAWAGAAGGILPDLPMYTFVAVLGLLGYSVSDIFDRLYWEPWWQIANAIGHNFLLWGTLTIVAALAVARSRTGQPPAPSPAPDSETAGAAALVFAFSASALLHSLIDFLTHRADAHMHLWPLSDWRFRSPVSYWDPDYYGNWFGLFEAALGVALIVVLFRRYRALPLRAGLLVVLGLYVAVPAFFYLTHHG